MPQQRGGHVQDLGRGPEGKRNGGCSRALRLGLPWKGLPAGQEEADSGEELGLGPRGPRDPPPGMW